MLSDPTKAQHHDSAYDALIKHITAGPAVHDDDRVAKVCARELLLEHCSMRDCSMLVLCVHFSPRCGAWCVCILLLRWTTRAFCTRHLLPHIIYNRTRLLRCCMSKHTSFLTNVRL